MYIYVTIYICIERKRERVDYAVGSVPNGLDVLLTSLDGDSQFLRSGCANLYSMHRYSKYTQVDMYIYIVCICIYSVAHFFGR